MSEPPGGHTSAWALALQAIAGVSVPLSRRLELAADFRYLRMPDIELQEVSGGLRRRGP